MPARPTLVALICLSCANLLFADETPAPAQVVDAFHKALEAGDSAAALSHLRRDVVVYEMGLVDRSRNAYFANHLQRDMRGARYYQRELSSRSSGGSGDQRWVLSSYRNTRSEGGRSTVHESIETMILRRQGNAWRIVHIHWSARPPRPR